MGSRNIDLWCNTNISEVILLKLSYTVAKKMIFRYVIPLVRRIYPIISGAATGKYLRSPQKFIKNKKTIAAHMKSVYNIVKIYVVTDAEVCNELIKCRMSGTRNVKFIGLDCEWDSSKKNGVALIQISSGNDCILYRTVKSNGVIPENLKQLLEDHHILKFGVAIQEDARRLQSHGINVNGFVDLRNLAQRCLPRLHGDHSLSKEEDACSWTSLKSLSVNTLDLQLIKNYEVTCSDWEAKYLTQSQILYAAKDAIVSLEIFYALVLLRKVSRQDTSVLLGAFEKEIECATEWGLKHLLDPIFSKVYLYSHKSDQLISMDVTFDGAFDMCKPSDWLVDLARSLCQGIINKNFKQPINYNKKRQSEPLVTQSRGISTKTSNLKEYRHQCRDKPMYENCFLKGPDKTILATVNRSKASWYVNKHLGKVTSEDPYTVELFFEPSGRPMSDGDYYTTIKDNVCVVCEGTEGFVRKMIIPHDYRRYFPLELKDHMSHDVLLLCLDCHRIAQVWDEQLRQELAVNYNAPLGTKDQRMFLNNPQLSKVKSAAKALHHNSSKIPEGRIKELRGILENYCGSEEVTDEVVKRLSDMDIKTKNLTFGEPHGQRVVDAFIQENKLPEFIRMWRQNFLSNMKPKHLPPMWSVEHNLDKLHAVKVSDMNN